MTEPNLPILPKFRLMRVLPVWVMVLITFSCERKEEGSQRLGNVENEEIAQVPLNQIPHPRPPLFDDSQKDQGISTADKVFDIVENPPKPKGGVEGWNQYLASNIKYPASAREKGIQGMVVVAFVVDSEGKITGAEILKGIGGGCDEEALRVINASPDWEPGQQGGKDVNVRMRLPIQFQLGSDSEVKEVAKPISSTYKIPKYDLAHRKLKLAPASGDMC